MDETVITTQESAMDTGTPVDTQPTDQTDDFLAGFDDEPETTEQADQPENVEDGSAATEPEQTSPSPEQSAPTDGAPENEPEQPDKEAEAEKPAERAWDFKYMGQQMHMTADQITPELLQKAHDYDRVRGKYDEAKPMIEIFSELARNANMSMEDFTKSVRMEAKRRPYARRGQARGRAGGPRGRRVRRRSDETRGRSGTQPEKRRSQTGSGHVPAGVPGRIRQGERRRQVSHPAKRLGRGQPRRTAGGGLQPLSGDAGQREGAAGGDRRKECDECRAQLRQHEERRKRREEHRPVPGRI